MAVAPRWWVKRRQPRKDHPSDLRSAGEMLLRINNWRRATRQAQRPRWPFMFIKRNNTANGLLRTSFFWSLPRVAEILQADNQVDHTQKLLWRQYPCSEYTSTITPPSATRDEFNTKILTSQLSETDKKSLTSFHYQNMSNTNRIRSS